jgi:hypothetical protein
MFDALFEQRIIQNTGLAAEIIWQAVHESYEGNRRENGVYFPLVFLILPLVFHKRTAQLLATKKQPGAIFKLLDDDREVLIGLQDRMQALYGRSVQALSIAFSTGLLKFDQQKHQLYPGVKSLHVEHVSDEVKTIFKATKRVGQTFSELSLVQVFTALEVRF